MHLSNMDRLVYITNQRQSPSSLRSRYLSNSTADIHRNGSPASTSRCPGVPALPRVLRGSSERHMIRSWAQRISPCTTKSMVIHPPVRIFLVLATLLALQSL